MRLSAFYLPAVRDVSSDVVAISHKYSLRAGLVAQVASGIYTWLPLGLRVLRKIEGIVREEMEAVGFGEVLMPAMQPASLWKESNRYDSYGAEMLRVKDRNNREMVYGPTHEEVVTDLVRASLKSYRDLPINLYQIQWKFRDELRPKNGVLRAREFLMMDGYSFDVDYDGAMQTYNAVLKAYGRVFSRMNLTAIAVSADAGAIGGNMSHEFHVLAPTGESTVYYEERALDLAKNTEANNIEALNKVYAAADEAHDDKNCKSNLKISKGIEVGHVFYLGDRYSKPMEVKFHCSDGVDTRYAHMGCYGIGLSRLVAAVIEVFHDNAGIKWPTELTPYNVGIVNLFPKNDKCTEVAEYLHSIFGDDSLYDDKGDSPGVKLSRMDLIGLPWQVVVGNSFVNDGVLELKNRTAGTAEVMSVENVILTLRR
ncbi:proline--tRNA ligase [Anaplasma platys]|uniref:Proline--tRNA ligase n=1 Tax=Anaplasma platys TaxID=949 RepID=A0A858PY93_9RICK|nr:proline--tRNA ligase [Anaplasma platys]QJC27549.1 proline--tRNA ligase [Anaplasma platys]